MHLCWVATASCRQQEDELAQLGAKLVCGGSLSINHKGGTWAICSELISSALPALTSCFLQLSHRHFLGRTRQSQCCVLS
eukprot:6064475-Amphidinium_carterae.2